MKTALVLAGHGSHISPQTAGLVWQQVDALRALGVVDEVTATFWKEMPSFSTVLNTLTANDITIVPLFTAAGYFTTSVIPTEMGLDGALTVRDGRTLRYTRPLGEHPLIRQVVQQRVEDALHQIDARKEDIGVAVIGHGTKRSATSRATTEVQAHMLRTTRLVHQVVAVYLDDTPSIPDLYDLLDTPVIIAVPNFLALGSHTTLDVPAELGLAPDETVGDINGRRVYYTDPVGVGDSLLQPILSLAAEVGATLSVPLPGSPWNGFPSAGRDALIESVTAQGEMPFGQLILTPSEVKTGDAPHRVLDHPALLRDFVRTMPQFRPLATATDLPHGWVVLVDTPDKLHAVVETVYPGVVADWAAHRKGYFASRTLVDTAVRQQGMFRQLEHFVHAEQVVERVCTGCIRHPTWHHRTAPPDAVPCSEPCNLWLSKALEFEV